LSDITYGSYEEVKEEFNPKPSHPPRACPMCGKDKLEWKLDPSGWWREFRVECLPEIIQIN